VKLSDVAVDELSSVPFGTSCSPEGVQKLLTGASFVNVDCS
jgi:hypothetical protein